MAKIRKKYFFICILLSFLFLSIDVLSPGLYNYTSINNSYSIVYAKSGGGGSHSSGGGFKSGGFSSPKSSSGSFSTPKSSSQAPKSSSGGFKSGSFSNTPNSSSGSTKSSAGNSSQPNINNTTPSQKSYDSGTKRSFLPIPIPIPWGHGGLWGNNYYGSNSGYNTIGSFIFQLFKIVIFIIIIIIIVRLIKKYRRR